MKVVLVSPNNRKADQSIFLVFPWDLLSWGEVLRVWLGSGDSLVAYSSGLTLKKDQMVNISGFACHLVSCNRVKTCIMYFLNKVLSTLWNIHLLTTSSSLALRSYILLTLWGYSEYPYIFSWASFVPWCLSINRFVSMVVLGNGWHISSGWLSSRIWI